MPTEDGWLDKAEAAAALGVDERTVERRARSGVLGARRQAGKPTVYNPADVAKLVPGSQPTHQGALVGPAQTPPVNGHGLLAPIGGPPAAIEGLVVQVLQAVLGALTQGPTGPTTAPTGPTLSPWMTELDIMRAWGWPRADVRALIVEGKLGETFRLGRGQRQRQVVRRSEVEAFAASGRGGQGL